MFYILPFCTIPTVFYFCMVAIFFTRTLLSFCFTSFVCTSNRNDLLFDNLFSTAQHYIANIESWVDALGPQYNENTHWLRFKLLVTPLSCHNKAPSHSIKQYSDLIFLKSINSSVQFDQSQRSLGEPDSKSTQLVETY